MAALSDPRAGGWASFAASHPDALPFHLPAWSDTLHAAYGFKPFVVTVADARGDVLAGLPLMELRDPVRGRRWSALPFTDRCPPLLGEPGAEARLAAALRAAAAEAGCARLEVRAELADLPAAAVATMQELDLEPGPDALERGFSSAARRNTRKARREGVVVRRAESEEDLTETYYALHLQTRHRLGVPVQPKRFFRALWRHMLEPGHGHLLLAFADDVPIAGAVFLYAGRTVVYKYGASDVSGWRLRPNNVLFTEAIRWSADAGYRRFDFGRSDFVDEGLRAFKKGWGADERSLVYSSVREGAVSAPDGGGKLLGEVIRRSPPGVCRALGETLYRYAA
jgi:CelD/BcsL family acetyltransferase involved in cellulose biosynthesis